MRDPKDIIHNGKTVAEILRLHSLWLTDDPGGERANLMNADLSFANLINTNLDNANLRNANLINADLGFANLNYANLINANLNNANLDNANLGFTNLGFTNLRNANLNNTVGNMWEVKSAQFDMWAITWTTAPNGTVTLQIGCQKHDLALWEKSDPHWIESMNDHAPEWWAKYRDVVLTLVKTSPATPWAEKRWSNDKQQ